MKTCFILFGVFLGALLLLSCDRRTPVELDLENENFLDDFDFVLLFNCDNPQQDSLQAIVYDRAGTFSSLEINGVPEQCDDIQEDPTAYIFTGLAIAPGDTVTYKLSAGKSSWQGKIIIPENPSLLLPHFNPDQNFTFSWACDDDPQKFVVNYLIYNTAHYHQGNDPYVLTEDREISGTYRSFTVPRSGWSDWISETMDHAEARVTAYNFRKHENRCVVAARTFDEGVAGE